MCVYAAGERCVCGREMAQFRRERRGRCSWERGCVQGREGAVRESMMRERDAVRLWESGCSAG